eukprot:403352838
MKALDNYYFQSFSEESEFGKVFIKQGVLKEFPKMFQPKCSIALSVPGDQQENSYVLLQKNLKVMQVANSKYIQLITCTKQLMIAYLHLENKFLIFSKKTKSLRSITLSVQGRPQVIKLNEQLLGLWFKNMAQLQILNVHTLQIEQCLFMPRKENWLQVSKICSGNLVQIELCFRNMKQMIFYELNTESYPFSFQIKEKINIYRQNQITHQSIISQSQIINIMNEAFCYEQVQALIIDRATKQEHIIKMGVEDKIILLNQCISEKNDLPVILKLQNHRIGLLTNMITGAFSFDCFKKMNSINQILSTNKNCGMYLQEEDGYCMIFILRKLDDGRGNVWRIKISKDFLKKAQKYLSCSMVQE